MVKYKSELEKELKTLEEAISKATKQTSTTQKSSTTNIKVSSPTTTSTTVKALNNYLLETVAESEQVVIEVLKNSASPLSRHEIMDKALQISKPSQRAMEKTKTGRERYKTNLDYAISRLLIFKVLNKVSKNAYTLNTANAKSYTTTAIKTAISSRAASKPKIVLKPIINVTVKEQPKAQTTNVTIAEAPKQEAGKAPIETQATKAKQEVTVTKAVELPELKSEKQEAEQTPKQLKEHKENPSLKDIEEEQNAIGEVSEYVTQVPDEYVPNKEVGLLIESALTSKTPEVIPILLKGATGIAKTMGVKYYAAKNNVPLIMSLANADMSITELVGGEKVFTDEKGNLNTIYKEGVLPAAVKLANKAGTAILLLDEINTLPENYQIALNSLLDKNTRAVFAPPNKKWALNKDAKLLVVGTMNPNYAGTHDLNQAVKRRFAEIELDYPTRKVETKILSKIIQDDALIGKLIDLAEFTRGETNNGRLTFALSPANLTDILKAYKQFSEAGETQEDALAEALKVFALYRYESTSEKDALAQRIKDIFSITV